MISYSKMPLFITFFRLQVEHVSLSVMQSGSSATAANTRTPSLQCQSSKKNKFQLEAKLSQRYKVNSTAKVCIKIWPSKSLTTNCQDHVTVVQKEVDVQPEIPSVPTIKPLDVVRINQNREQNSWDSWLR